MFIRGVRKLCDEFIFTIGIDHDKGVAEKFIYDTVTENKINGLLLDAECVNLANFSWRAVSCQALMFGCAFSKTKSIKAVGVVKGIKNDVTVTNRLKVIAK